MTRVLTAAEQHALGKIDYHFTTAFVLDDVDHALMLTCSREDGSALNGDQPDTFLWPLTIDEPVTAEVFDHWSLLPNWQPATAYDVGDRVRNGWGPRYTYICTQAGTSGSAPGPIANIYGPGTKTVGAVPDGTCTWTKIEAPSRGLLGLPWGIGNRAALNYQRGVDVVTFTYDEWQASTAYTVGTRVFNPIVERRYVCVVAGTSGAAPGPVSTGQGIIDGTCIWDYVPGQLLSSGGAPISFETRPDLRWIVFEVDPLAVAVNRQHKFALAESGTVRLIGTALEAKDYLIAEGAPPTNNWWHQIWTGDTYDTARPDDYLSWMTTV